MTKKQKKMLTRIVAAGVLFAIINILPFDRIPGIWGMLISYILYLADYIIIGHDILRKAIRNIKNGRVFDECFLMTVATLGAIGLAIYEKSGDFNEAVAVMLFYQVGELFESYAVGKSRKNITALMDIRPDYANIEKDGKLVQVSPDEIPIGSVIVVRPGEKVPIDGIIEEGAGTINTSALTGESLPRDVAPGDEIISGCINNNSVLKIKTTKLFGESTVSKILTLVEDATQKKSKSENFISKFARIYTPIVCYSALALAVLPPVVLLIAGRNPELNIWLYRALTFLVVSCPCALVISIPLSFFAGIGGASHNGILVKGSNYLEALSKVKTIVFDKTGTLTKGVFEVTEIATIGIEKSELLEKAALCECDSTHPIAKSLINAYGKDIDRNRVSNITEISGAGITADIDGVKVAVGTLKLMNELSVKEIITPSAVGTVLNIAVDGRYAGYIVIADIPKETSKKAVKALKSCGIGKTVMLTGDQRAVAQSVAKELGIDEVFYELLPQDKVSKVEELLTKKGGKEILAFVGDGINDAPVLSRSDLGIAMGAMGSDAAIEAADVILMDDNPLKIAQGIRISKKCIRIVYENITFALLIKLGCLVLTALGIANMWYAIFADVGVMVLAVLNAVRALNCSTHGLVDKNCNN